MFNCVMVVISRALKLETAKDRVPRVYCESVYVGENNYYL